MKAIDNSIIVMESITPPNSLPMHTNLTEVRLVTTARQQKTRFSGKLDGETARQERLEIKQKHILKLNTR